MTFGEYVRKKRLERKITLRKFAEIIEKSPTLISAIENGDKTAPSDEVLKVIVQKLELSQEETEILYDLAAETKTNNPIPADITETIKNNSTIKVALRVAKNLDATDDEWEDFMRRLEEKRNKGDV